jgi:aspartyl/asparaginyl beta-hydroxylase (cupin superfamily)
MKGGVRRQRRSEVGLVAYSVSYPVDLALVVKATNLVEMIECHEKPLKFGEHLSRQALDLVCIVR